MLCILCRFPPSVVTACGSELRPPLVRRALPYDRGDALPFALAVSPAANLHRSAASKCPPPGLLGTVLKWDDDPDCGPLQLATLVPVPGKRPPLPVATPPPPPSTPTKKLSFSPSFISCSSSPFSYPLLVIPPPSSSSRGPSSVCLMLTFGSLNAWHASSLPRYLSLLPHHFSILLEPLLVSTYPSFFSSGRLIFFASSPSQDSLFTPRLIPAPPISLYLLSLNISYSLYFFFDCRLRWRMPWEVLPILATVTSRRMPLRPLIYPRLLYIC
ncbi:unnamed protein product [Schistocephalus solidus]|uniref:Vegetative cell wall protein gp1-like n=1 Tax=Schistocephalus solidus TaxID=70667 RepID=A0A183T311_SCHSO|nr:unnamed protein product [Schistocephalus solidus]